MGEDGVVEKLFDLLNIKSGWLVEFGAWDGVHLSNTRYHYLKNNNFKRLLIEPDVDRFNDLVHHCENENAILLNKKVEIEGEDSLNNIFDLHNVRDIALLSIDVDGDDLNIWKSLNTVEFRPKIVIIEFGDWVIKENLDRLHNCFYSRNYSLICVTGNFIFVDKDLGIRPFHNIHYLMHTSGSQEYDSFFNKIDDTEANYRTERQKFEKDLYSKTAGPQYINHGL
jgi:hypothetical protein